VKRKLYHVFKNTVSRKEACSEVDDDMLRLLSKIR
jgi:hypothetical protein